MTDQTTLDPALNAERARAALARVLASETFARSPQLSQFLEFVLERAIAGEIASIKAYTIAVGALGRSEDFDPQIDPIVRVQAGRVRQALTSYYAGAGAGDPERIELPVGSYAPRVTVVAPEKPAPEQSDATDAPSQSRQENAGSARAPTAQFRRLSDFAAGIAAAALLALIGFYVFSVDRDAPVSPSIETASVSTSLTRVFPTVSIDVDAPRDLPDWIASEIAPGVLASRIALFDDVALVDRGSGDFQFALSATPPQNGRVQVNARAVRASDAVVVWSREVIVSPDDPVDAQSVVNPVRRAIATVFSPYGVLHAQVAATAGASSDYGCIATSYGYFFAESEEARQASLACLAELNRAGLRHPTMFALETWLQLDGFRQQRGDAEASLAAARAAAEAGIAASPASARAHQALFAYYKVVGDQENALKHAVLARRANPFDLDILGDVAAYHVATGQLSRAEMLFRQVDAIALVRPAWLDAFDVFLAALLGDADAMTAPASRLGVSKSALAASAILLASDALDDRDRRREAIDAIARHEPSMLTAPEDAFLRRGFVPAIAARLSSLVSVAVDRAS